MKVSSLASVPANSRWRIVWNSETAPGQQWYVGMRSDASSNVSFEYGNVATAVVGLVIGVPTKQGVGRSTAFARMAPSRCSFRRIWSAVRSRRLAGRGERPDLHGRHVADWHARALDAADRSHLVKAQRDNGSPAATYT